MTVATKFDLPKISSIKTLQVMEFVIIDVDPN